MIAIDGERFRLTIALDDAIAFALGQTNLGYEAPDDIQRQIIGLFAVDNLQYYEQWRAAALVRACLVDRWPGMES